MCASTHEHCCYYPGKILLLPPPPTESRRLVEITEKTQEIQRPQLGTSELLLNFTQRFIAQH